MVVKMLSLVYWQLLLLLLLVLLLRVTRQRLHGVKLAAAADVSQRVSAFGCFLAARRALSGVDGDLKVIQIILVVL